MKNLGIHFGALADSLEEQLDSQGFKIPKNIELFQRLADALVDLHVMEILANHQMDLCRKKLLKKIVKALEEETTTND